MYYSRRIISILISIVLALCTGGVVFAEDTASEGIEGGTTAAKQVEQEVPEVAEDPEAEPALPEAAEAEETPEATEETEATASDEVAGNDYDGEAVSPAEYVHIKVVPSGYVFKELPHVFDVRPVSFCFFASALNEPSLENDVVAYHESAVSAYRLAFVEELPVMALCRIYEYEIVLLGFIGIFEYGGEF